MLGYIFGIVLAVILIVVTIVSNYTFLLTQKQMYELWISTILMMVLFGYTRTYFLKLAPMSNYIFIPTTLYVIWYLGTKVMGNIINKDSGVIRDSMF